MFVFVVVLASLLMLSASQAIAQDTTPAAPTAPPTAPATAEREKRPSFRIGGEAKLGIRRSEAEAWRIPINTLVEHTLQAILKEGRS